MKGDLTPFKMCTAALGPPPNFFEGSIIAMLREERRWNHIKCSIKARGGRRGENLMQGHFEAQTGPLPALHIELGAGLARPLQNGVTPPTQKVYMLAMLTPTSFAQLFHILNVLLHGKTWTF